MKTVIDISLIIPMYNEEEMIYILFKELNRVLDKIKNYSYEIICVDDGSKDNTLKILKEMAESDTRIKILSFSRNFGKVKAMSAGLDFCSGKAAIIIDADLQDPVDLIIEFIKKWEEGYDNVYGFRSDRKQDSFFKRWSAVMFYKLCNKMSDIPIPYNAGDSRLIDRKIIENVKRINDRKKFMQYIFNWSGFKSIGVGFVRPARAAGNTKWNYWGLWNLALEGIVSSTTLPLRIWSYFGALISALSLLFGAYTIIKSFVLQTNLLLFGGFNLILSLIFLFIGIQFIALGIMGEYMGRILEETRDRPKYIIEEKINFD
ncbi:MAG: glycosyltransferase family 2 protein [Elusimicrobiota bacterium]|jgi:glycosyltransferase involved in cell wall biosynthesis|nr:glycosyltransferase family 2 protein [Elusimicrobiota bacterium]